MTILVFTICARNYIGLARVLGQSVARHGGDTSFRIYVAEGIDAETAAIAAEAEVGNAAIFSAPDALGGIIDPIEFANMAFMYNLTEFCTALKAACFSHAFAEGHDTCIYMDPDIFLMADIGLITGALDGSAILMTPHLCLPAMAEGPRPDHGILATGIYNLGFLALRRHPETPRFLGWWHERLRRQAFNDNYRSLYTDQRWMDFVPSLFPAEAVRVWRHLGCNVAPWNYHERRVGRAGGGDGDDAGFVVEARDESAPDDVFPLIFLHFSGFDFRRILDGQFDQLNLADAETHADLLPIYKLYGEAIRAMSDEMKQYLTLPYGFDRFADGSPILPTHRRLFRIWRERHGNAADPFAVRQGSFHAALGERGLLARAGTADLAADKATIRSVAQPERLLGRAHTLFRLLFRVLGRSRFFFLVRSLHRLSHVEQHYDTFRLDEARITVETEHRPDTPPC